MPVITVSQLSIMCLSRLYTCCAIDESSKASAAETNLETSSLISVSMSERVAGNETAGAEGATWVDADADFDPAIPGSSGVLLEVWRPFEAAPSGVSNGLALHAMSSSREVAASSL